MHKKRYMLKSYIFFLISLCIFAAIGAFAYGSYINNSFVKTDVKSKAAGNCTISDKLVNSCRPWLGAVASYYSMAGDIWTKRIQMDYFEKRLNNPNVLTNVNDPTTVTHTLDFVHFYLGPSERISGSVLYYATRDTTTYLQLNWKPVDGLWSTAAGGDATVNANIDAMADSFNSLAQQSSKKVLFTIVHEPENDVTPGTAGGCYTASSGTKGSPSDYVNMWHNIRARFDAKGVNNVVWNMNYMGYTGYNCLVPLLWPGNSYVDWITFDPYAGGTQSFASSLSSFYSFLETSSDAAHDYTGKIWGLGEHGYWDQNGSQGSTDAQYVTYWQQVADAIYSNTFPRLKLYSVFDASPDPTLQASTYTTGSFIGLKKTTNITPYIEGQTAFNSYAALLFAYDGSLPVQDTESPTGSITSPTWQQNVSGTVNINVTAADNVGVAKVDFIVDGIGTIATDTNSPYSASWNTNSLASGQYTIRARIYDAAGNTKTPATLVNVQNNIIQGDINGDAKVNAIDLSMLLANWNTSSSVADLNQDGIVNGIDLSMLLSYWMP